jgi:hypothetical protein
MFKDMKVFGEIPSSKPIDCNPTSSSKDLKPKIKDGVQQKLDMFISVTKKVYNE